MLSATYGIFGSIAGNFDRSADPVDRISEDVLLNRPLIFPILPPYSIDYPIPPAVGQYPQSIILKVSKTIGSGTNLPLDAGSHAFLPYVI